MKNYKTQTEGFRIAYTIEKSTDKQKIYEHLMTLGCPNLLAALIAERRNVDYNDTVTPESLRSWVIEGFLWNETPEGLDFWNEIDNCICDGEHLTDKPEAEDDVPTVGDVIESTEREMFDSVMKVHDVDFESPTEADFTKDKKDLAKIYTAYPVKSTVKRVGFTQEKVSFWTKVKLFFGR